MLCEGVDITPPPLDDKVIKLASQQLTVNRAQLK
jgi:hypothetical protein